MKLCERGLYGIGTARKDMKGMTEMLVKRKMTRGDFKYLYFDKVACCKWLDMHSVTMLFRNAEEMAKTSTVPQRQKRSSSKMQVSCSDVIKLHNKGKGGVDLIDQWAEAYHLDRKSTIRFYLRIFFCFMDIRCANNYIVYNMMHANDLTLFNFKTIVSTYLIGRYTSRNRAPPDGKTGSKRMYQYQFEQGNLPSHLPEFQNI